MNGIYLINCFRRRLPERSRRGRVPKKSSKNCLRQFLGRKLCDERHLLKQLLSPSDTIKGMKKHLLLALLSVLVLQLHAAKKVSPPRQKFISCALSFEDTPYVWGGQAPGGFDCSGFVNYVGEKSLDNRIQFPRTAAAIYEKFPHISKKDREPGDLVFFRDTPKSKIFHVGIYCGIYHGPQKKYEGKRVFMSAVSKGKKGVKLSLIDEGYWLQYDICYARFLRSTDDYNKAIKSAKKQGSSQAELQPLPKEGQTAQSTRQKAKEEPAPRKVPPKPVQKRKESIRDRLGAN